MQFLSGSYSELHQILCNLTESAMETLAMIRQAFQEDSMCSIWMGGKVQNQDQKKPRHVKTKVKSILIIFTDIKGIVHKEFVLAGQTVNCTYCCDVLW
jgi:hypothetical protein